MNDRATVYRRLAAIQQQTPHDDPPTYEDWAEALAAYVAAARRYGSCSAEALRLGREQLVIWRRYYASIRAA